jgi:hypothetical protein
MADDSPSIYQIGVADGRAIERERIRYAWLGGDPNLLETRFRAIVDDDEAADCALIITELLQEAADAASIPKRQRSADEHL